MIHRDITLGVWPPDFAHSMFYTALSVATWVLSHSLCECSDSKCTVHGPAVAYVYSIGKRVQNRSWHRIQVWDVWWSQCHVRLNGCHFHVNCFLRCEIASAVLLQRPLLMAAPCTNTVTLGQKTFSSLILTADLGPGSKNTTLVFPVRETSTDTVMLEF